MDCIRGCRGDMAEELITTLVYADHTIRSGAGPANRATLDGRLDAGGTE